MYATHHAVSTPPGDTVIWRYIIMENLQLMIESDHLHFTRLDHFSDDHEGSVPEENHRRRVDGIRTPLEGKFPDVNHFYLTASDGWRTLNFASCWHMHKHENALMWQCYADHGKGVAVKSTVRRMKSAFGRQSPPFVFIGRVKYLDFKTDYLPLDNFMGLAYSNLKDIFTWSLAGKKGVPASAKIASYVPFLNTKARGYKRILHERWVYNVTTRLEVLGERYAHLICSHCRILCDDGWQDLIERVLIHWQVCCPQVQISTLKEKMGTLRIYPQDRLHPRANALCKWAHSKSESVCESCGSQDHCVRVATCKRYVLAVKHSVGRTARRAQLLLEWEPGLRNTVSAMP